MARAALRRPVQRMPAERRIADIMVAARAILTERGANDALISDIAERAGVVEGSIYRFFSNKRDLVERVVEGWYEDMLADYGAQCDGVRGARNQLRFVVHHHLASIKREPALSRIMLQEFRPAPNYRKTRLFQLNQTYSQRIVDIVKAAVATGEFRPGVSPGIVRDMIFGCIEHRIWAFLRNEGDFDPVEISDAITDLVYRALAPDTGTDSLSLALDRLDETTARLEQLTRSKPPVRARKLKS